MRADSTILLKKLLLIFLVFAGLYYAKDFLIPLAIGGILATLLLPLCRWMEGHKFSRGVAALICLFILLLAIAAIFTLLGWQISELTNDVELVKKQIASGIQRIQESIYNKIGISLEKQKSLIQDQQSSIPGILQTMAGSLTSIFTGFILTLVYVFLFLYYRFHLKKFILQLSQSNQQEEVKHVVYKAAFVSQQYLVGLAKMIACLWIMYGIGFSILGVKNPLFYAFLCGLLEIVPFIGNITGTSITLIVSAGHGAEFPVLVGIALTYGTVQFIQGWVLEPLILGPQVKINPLFTIIALVIGQLIWGIPGIVLAIPLTAMFKIVCDHIQSLKPYGFLIGELQTKKTENNFIKQIKHLFKKTGSKK